jgi:hypothetical protein
MGLHHCSQIVFILVLGINPRASRMPGKHLALSYVPSPRSHSLQKVTILSPFMKKNGSVWED